MRTADGPPSRSRGGAGGGAPAGWRRRGGAGGQMVGAVRSHSTAPKDQDGRDEDGKGRPDGLAQRVASFEVVERRGPSATR